MDAVTGSDATVLGHKQDCVLAARRSDSGRSDDHRSYDWRMQDQPGGTPRETPIGDAEREVVVGRIRRAMVDDLIAFDEIDARFEAIYAANTRAELALVTGDLPALPPPSTALQHPPIAPRHFSVFGEIKKSGDMAIDGEVSFRSVFGSVVVDLSASSVLSDGATIRAESIFGEVTVIVPDGYRVAIDARSMFGSSVDALSRPLPGSAAIRVKVATVFGETKVFSLSQVPQGALRRMWNRLWGRSNPSSER